MSVIWFKFNMTAKIAKYVPLNQKPFWFIFQVAIERTNGIRISRCVKIINIGCRMIVEFHKLKMILTDGGYRNDGLKQKVKALPGCQLEVVIRLDQCPKRFAVIPKHWIVERSFAWRENYRRIAMDYEFYSKSSEAMLQIIFSQSCLKIWRIGQIVVF